MRSHQELDQRSLELHQFVAQKLRRQPELFDRVRTNITRRQMTTSAHGRRYLLEWEKLAGEGLERCLAVATEDSDRAAALRQASPFAGVLTPQERMTFLRQWRRIHGT